MPNDNKIHIYNDEGETTRERQECLALNDLGSRQDVLLKEML